jgi:hypothetical protein
MPAINIVTIYTLWYSNPIIYGGVIRREKIGITLTADTFQLLFGSGPTGFFNMEGSTLIDTLTIQRGEPPSTINCLRDLRKHIIFYKISLMYRKTSKYAFIGHFSLGEWKLIKRELKACNQITL